MNILGGILAPLAALAIALAYCYRWGRRDGYEAGRKAADNWWMTAEQETDRERQKIWREES